MENGWDFFLQAHDCLKGTARPAHYVVLRNDFKDMGAKQLETIVSPASSTSLPLALHGFANT